MFVEKQQNPFLLTKYIVLQTLLGELILKDLTPNYTSQALVISVYFDVDANGILEVIAEETRSGAQTKLRITNDKGNCYEKNVQIYLILSLKFFDSRSSKCSTNRRTYKICRIECEFSCNTDSRSWSKWFTLSGLFVCLHKQSFNRNIFV